LGIVSPPKRLGSSLETLGPGTNIREARRRSRVVQDPRAAHPAGAGKTFNLRSRRL